MGPSHNNWLLDQKQYSTSPHTKRNYVLDSLYVAPRPPHVVGHGWTQPDRLGATSRGGANWAQQPKAKQSNPQVDLHQNGKTTTSQNRWMQNLRQQAGVGKDSGMDQRMVIHNRPPPEKNLFNV